MKKKKLVLFLTLCLLLSAFFTNPVIAASHTHTWKYDGAYIPPSQSTHYFWHTHSDGATYYESCIKSVTRYRTTKTCTVCGTQETTDGESISHSSSHCPSY